MRNEVSNHYLGDQGAEYFQGRFGQEVEFGRVYQSRYFQPYCDETKGVLDFGCGDGTILRALPARVKRGIEINPVCQEVIRQKNDRTQVPIALYDDIREVDDESVDVVISNHCLEHVLHPLTVLREMRRVLVAGGALVLVVPFDDWRSWKSRQWRARDPDHHLYTWSPLNLGNLVSEAGFAVRQARVSTCAWSPKMFWIGEHLGLRVFRAACYLLAVVKRRREILCVARKEMGGSQNAG